MKEIERGVLLRKYDTFSNEIDEGVYRKIEKAFNNRAGLEIEYFSMSFGETVKRAIDVYYKSRKYVIGFCHLRKAIRRFRVSRIVKAKLINKHYKIPNDFDKNRY